MYKIILAIRYLLRRRISYFAVAAVALCVFMVFVVITVLTGLTDEFKNNAHLSTGDCVLSSRSLVGFGYYDEFLDILEKQDFVEAASPVIKSYALIDITEGLGSVSNTHDTVEIVGIEPVPHSKVTGFAQGLHHHKTDVENAFKPSYAPDLPGCVPGVGFLFSRDSQGNYRITEKLPMVELEISCFPLTPKGALAKAGAGLVNTKTFFCSDHTHSGVAMEDFKRIYLPFNEVQMLCGMTAEPQRVNAIHIKFIPGQDLETSCNKVTQLWSDFVKTKAGAKQANLLKNVRVQSWKNYGRILVAAVETEQIMMIICFAIIGIIAAFIVFVVFYMIVCHKTKDIGILKSIGVPNSGVLSLFLFFSFLMSLAGSAIGAIGGWQFLLHINNIEDWLYAKFGFQLWTRTMYAIGDIPNTIDLKVLSVIIVSAIAVCLAGALIPSWQAAKYQPVETLRVNQL